MARLVFAVENYKYTIHYRKCAINRTSDTPSKTQQHYDHTIDEKIECCPSIYEIIGDLSHGDDNNDELLIEMCDNEYDRLMDELANGIGNEEKMDFIACISEAESDYGEEHELIFDIDFLDSVHTMHGGLNMQLMHNHANQAILGLQAEANNEFEHDINIVDSIEPNFEKLPSESEDSDLLKTSELNTQHDCEPTVWNWQSHYTSNFMGKKGNSFAEYIDKAIISPHFNEMGLAKLFPFSDMDVEVTRNLLFQRYDRKLHYEILCNIEGAFDILMSQ
jgi:hypothetical protein